MEDLLVRFLHSSGIDPVYFVTGIVDLISIFLWTRLKLHLSDVQRSMYKATIIVAILLTAGVLCKYFGFVTNWKDVESFWNS